MAPASRVQPTGKTTSSVPAWPEWLFWILCCIPVVHAGLLFINPHTPYVLTIHFLRPIGMLGAVVLFFYSASLASGYRRWAWVFIGVAIIFSIVFSVLRIVPGLSITTPLLQALPILIYSFGLIGTGFYLQHTSWWVGSTPRVILGGITTGWATLVILRSILPAIVPTWPLNSQVSVILAYLALDTCIVFALVVVGVRYGLHQSPLVWLAFLATFCLLIADTVYMLVSWLPLEGMLPIHLHWPLYTFHSIILAFGAYRDVIYSRQERERIVMPMTEMPMREWVLWTFAPLAAVLAAFTATSLVGRVPSLLLFGLLGVAIVHEVLAAFDYRRVLQNLRLTYTQVQQANTELARANSELSKAHEQVRATASTMEAFVARVVHDLAPPVQGLLSVGRDTSWRKDQHYLQHILLGQVALLEAFVHQARSYIMARTISLRREKLDLLPICLSAVAAAQPRAEQRGVQIVQDILVESPIIVGDETAVRRILDNLLTNAVGISSTGAKVILSVTAPTPEQIQIAVQDQGPGIPPEKQAQLFKPYTSLQFPSLEDDGRSPSPTGTGMGLGLAIVKELSLALGGDCGVTSAPNAGSTFYVRLPVEPATSQASLLVREGEADAHHSGH